MQQIEKKKLPVTEQIFDLVPVNILRGEIRLHDLSASSRKAGFAPLDFFSGN
jgi:hypothetical protein